MQANQGLCRKRWHAAEGELLRVSNVVNKFLAALAALYLTLVTE